MAKRDAWRITESMPAKPPSPSDLADKFMLRFPEGMRDVIAARAAANKRSMNSEIVARLAESLNGAERERLERLERQLSAALDALARIERRIGSGDR